MSDSCNIESADPSTMQSIDETSSDNMFVNTMPIVPNLDPPRPHVTVNLGDERSRASPKISSVKNESVGASEFADSFHRLGPKHMISSDEGAENILWDLFCDPNSHLANIDDFLREVLKTGLQENDPRLKESVHGFKHFKQAERTNLIYEEKFKEIILRNITILSKAFGSEFTVDKFEDFKENVRQIYEECLEEKSGKNAQYIPQLAKMDPNLWGVAVCTVDGQRAFFGDSHAPFTIQSSSKPLMYAIAATDLGPQVVHNYVGTEPSGAGFMEITLNSQKKPHNPMINSGAIIVASLVQASSSPSEKFDYVQKQFTKLCGHTGHVGFNNSVYLSEKGCAWRNYALAYYMKENGCFPPDVDLHEALELYFQSCSIEFDAESLSVIAATLAKGGICPLTEKKLLDSDVVQNTLSIMYSCGMYDYSGAFAFKVGLPAKSAVSGAIMLVIPNHCGIALFSPPLDSCGNSVRGLKFCNELVKRIPFHLFSHEKTLNTSSLTEASTINVMYAAQKGDLSAFRCFSLRGVDLNQSDYDQRTALHLAAAEGHMTLVKFLLERCRVKIQKDRWGHTPDKEADTFGYPHIAEYIRTFSNSKTDTYTTRRKSMTTISTYNSNSLENP